MTRNERCPRVDSYALNKDNAPLAGVGPRKYLFERQQVANIKSAQKRARQAEKRRMHNMALRSRMRTSIKNVLKAIDAGKRDEAVRLYKDAVPVIDSMVNKGIVKANKAARHKSRLNKHIRAMQA